MALDRVLLTRLMWRQDPDVDCPFVRAIFERDARPDDLTLAARTMRGHRNWIARADALVGDPVRGRVRRLESGSWAYVSHAKGEFYGR